MAVAIAAFLYIGFLAAAEEIEQPFGAFPIALVDISLILLVGYEENDLDLDFLIREVRALLIRNSPELTLSQIIHVDIEALLARPTPNSHICPKGEEEEPSQGAIADVCKIHHSMKAAQAEVNGKDHYDNTPTLQVPPTRSKTSDETQSSSALPPQVAVTVQQQPQQPSIQMASQMPRVTAMPTTTPMTMAPTK